MRKIIIPIDLTAASLNAVMYAGAFGNNSDLLEIILTANSHRSTFEQLFPSPDYLPASPYSQEEHETILKKRFSEIRALLGEHLNTTITLTFSISRKPLIEGLKELISNESADLMIIGSDLHNGLIGNHLIAIAKASTIPVLLVPMETAYQPIQTALVPYNSSNATRLGLITMAHIFSTYPKPKLLLLDVKDNDQQLPEWTEGTSFRDMIGDYSYEFFSATDQDILETIQTFVNTIETQLLIALPGKHGFFHQLTHQSVTENLVKNMRLPLLILKPQNLAAAGDQ